MNNPSEAVRDMRPLLLYGRCAPDCATCHDNAQKPRPVCTCGFQQALDRDAALAAEVEGLRGENRRYLSAACEQESRLIARAQRAEAQVERLQAALCYWLPTIAQVTEQYQGRVMQDAMLLMGFTGGTHQLGYHGQVSNKLAACEADARRWQKCKGARKSWWLAAMAEAGNKGGRSLDEQVDALPDAAIGAAHD